MLNIDFENRKHWDNHLLWLLSPSMNFIVYLPRTLLLPYICNPRNVHYCCMKINYAIQFLDPSPHNRWLWRFQGHTSSVHGDEFASTWEVIYIWTTTNSSLLPSYPVSSTSSSEKSWLTVKHRSLLNGHTEVSIPEAIDSKSILDFMHNRNGKV